jgi:hypothetical protein
MTGVVTIFPANPGWKLITCLSKSFSLVPVQTPTNFLRSLLDRLLAHHQCAVSVKKNNDQVVEASNNGAHHVATTEEVVEIIEEDYTEPGLNSDAESVTCEDDNLIGECSYFAKDRRVFTEELRPMIVELKQPTVTSEFDV